MLRCRTVLATAVFSLALGASALATHILPAIPRGDIAVHLEPVATGMGAPDYAISPPGDLNRVFIIEQQGQLRLMVNDVLQSGNVLDIQPRISTSHNPTSFNDERGFLGLAFHPQFSNPNHPGFQKLYTYNSEPTALRNAPTFAVPNGATRNYDLVVAEWTINGNVVDPASRREILSIGHNASNHNGGTLAFGPDGYLYMAPGDGGNANDAGASHVEPTGNAQIKTNVLGKVLRIDPLNPALTASSTDPIAGNGQYRIPADNPFRLEAGAMPEIYAYGLRNPYRFAFDRGGTHDLILADVGQNNIEEINRIVKGGNYGWAKKEGTFLFNRLSDPTAVPPVVAGTIGARSPDSPAGLLDPIEGTPDPVTGARRFLEYDHGDGISITGGFVYRGSAIPELFGKYVFGDLAIRSVAGQGRIDGRLFYADLEDGTIFEFLIPQFANDQLPNQVTVHGFGEDGNGELFALVTNSPPNGTGGIVYKFEAVVPEPGTMSLLGIAAAGLLGCSRRRR